MRDGGAAFAATGTEQSTGTKLFCVSGCAVRPGVYEVPFGITLKALIDRAGGVRDGRPLQAVLLGGAAGVFVTPDEIDFPLTVEGARAAGATLGSGVVMLFDDRADLRDTTMRIAEFFRHESCGQCVPCRVGTVRQEEALHRLSASPASRETGCRPHRRPRAGDARRVDLRARAHGVDRRAVGHQKAPGVWMIQLTIDGRTTHAPEGTTILQACNAQGIDTPTLCHLKTLTPVNACRLCVVELEGARALAPACSRKVEAGMVVRTDTDRVRHSRKLILELLGSSVDLSLASADLKRHMREYGAEPERLAGATVAQPVKVDNDLYVRDYSKCVLCYKCVEACGTDAQNTFAIAVAGRGFDAHISTESDRPLPDSACVYCGNCIGVCPTGALMFKSEHDMRQAGTWDESKQTVTDTICPYCGVGCTLQLHVQDNDIVRVTSPLDHDVTSGHLCIKGRFGWQFVQNR